MDVYIIKKIKGGMIDSIPGRIFKTDENGDITVLIPTDLSVKRVEDLDKLMAETPQKYAGEWWLPVSEKIKPRSMVKTEQFGHTIGELSRVTEPETVEA